MNAWMKERFARAAARKSTDELARMFVHSGDWEPETLEAAKEELAKRKAALPAGEGAIFAPEVREEDESVWKVVQETVRDVKFDLGPSGLG